MYVCKSGVLYSPLSVESRVSLRDRPSLDEGLHVDTWRARRYEHVPRGLWPRVPSHVMSKNMPGPSHSLTLRSEVTSTRHREYSRHAARPTSSQHSGLPPQAGTPTDTGGARTKRPPRSASFNLTVFSEPHVLHSRHYICEVLNFIVVCIFSCLSSSCRRPMLLH